MYPFATPWWIPLFYDHTPGTETLRLLAGCAINLGLVAWVGHLIGRKGQRDTAQSPASD